MFFLFNGCFCFQLELEETLQKDPNNNIVEQVDGR